ncbi:MAG: hypothetical protein D6732_23630 [Methanobacteriota archaeon]|nr:MAG: hypothetical protein D6732_23630 [Euryarchaeota archaeon]
MEGLIGFGVEKMEIDEEKEMIRMGLYGAPLVLLMGQLYIANSLFESKIPFHLVAWLGRFSILISLGLLILTIWTAIDLEKGQWLTFYLHYATVPYFGIWFGLKFSLNPFENDVLQAIPLVALMIYQYAVWKKFGKQLDMKSRTKLRIWYFVMVTFIWEIGFLLYSIERKLILPIPVLCLLILFNLAFYVKEEKFERIYAKYFHLMFLYGGLFLVLADIWWKLQRMSFIEIQPNFLLVVFASYSLYSKYPREKISSSPNDYGKISSL